MLLISLRSLWLSTLCSFSLTWTCVRPTLEFPPLFWACRFHPKNQQKYVNKLWGAVRVHRVHGVHHTNKQSNFKYVRNWCFWQDERQHFLYQLGRHWACVERPLHLNSVDTHQIDYMFRYNCLVLCVFSLNEQKMRLPHGMLQMRSLLPAQLVGQTCERSYRTFQFGRIFAGFSIVDTNWPE